MAITLKEQHTHKKLQILTERVKAIDTQIINENRAANLLLEAMDQGDLDKASAIIDQLTAIKGKGLPSVDNAVAQATAEINKFTGGGPIAGALSKLKGKLGFDNPLVKILALANALETGFKQVPQIIKNNVGQLTPEQADQTLEQIANSAQSAGKATVSGGKVTDSAENVKTTLVTNVLKALKPKGFFSSFKKIPYIDMNALADELTKVPLKNLNAIVKQVTSGPQASEVAQSVQDVAKQAGEVETKAPAEATPAAPTGQTTPATPAKPGTAPAQPSTKTGEAVPPVNKAEQGLGDRSMQPNINKRKELAIKYKDDPNLKGINVDVLRKVIDVLQAGGELKENSSRQHHRSK